MKQHKRKLALLAAAILACSAAGCAGTQNQSSAQSQSQLGWWTTASMSSRIM